MHDPSLTVPDQIREGVSTSGAKRNWPMNCWWVVAHGSELGSTPVMRWVLEMPVALYRTADGKPVALHNRCPHRWAPLSMGAVRGDDLVCPYHGMQFAPSGQCVKVPTQDHTPGAIRVRSFPIEERYGFLWLWTGDPGRADPALIPEELSFLADSKWHMVWGYLSVRGNYMQLKENVLDLTHFAFLHAKSLQITDWNKPPKVETTDTTVTYRQYFEMQPLAPVYAEPAGKPVGKRANRESWGRYLGPSSHCAGIDMHDPEPGPEGLTDFSLRVVHLTTPVSIARTHYFWAFARDHGVPYDYESSRAGAAIVFGEDVTMVEASQAMAQRSIDQENAIEFSVAADRAAIEARRRVEALIRAEQAVVQAVTAK